MRRFRNGQTKRPPEPALGQAIVDDWVYLCPAFLAGAQAHNAPVGSAWVTLLPLVLAEPEPPDLSELYEKGEASYSLARTSGVPNAVPAGSLLRLFEVAWYDHIGTVGKAFVFEVADGPMIGLRFNIWDLERDVAWRQGFANISRAISMIVPVGAPEVADRTLTQVRLRAVEGTLEAFRLFAIEHWEHIGHRFMYSGPPGPLEPADLPLPD